MSGIFTYFSFKYEKKKLRKSFECIIQVYFDLIPPLEASDETVLRDSHLKRWTTRSQTKLCTIVLWDLFFDNMK